MPEVALIGRSNAGKSSLLNTLVGRRRLARTSSTPGKTRRIHFYRVANSLYLVDLPGYGYAAVPQEERRSWSQMIQGYLGAEREVLRGALLLMDVRRDVSADEANLVAWLRRKGVPVGLVLSKADKLSARLQARAVKEAAGALELEPGAIAAVSVHSNRGLGLVVDWIRGWTHVELRRADGTVFKN